MVLRGISTSGNYSQNASPGAQVCIKPLTESFFWWCPIGQSKSHGRALWVTCQIHMGEKHIRVWSLGRYESLGAFNIVICHRSQDQKFDFRLRSPLDIKCRVWGRWAWRSGQRSRLRCKFWSHHHVSKTMRLDKVNYGMKVDREKLQFCSLILSVV
jgi:hypothetical protein